MSPSSIPFVDPNSVSAQAVLLDVREPDEWQAGHIEGAVHIPLAELPARSGELSGAADLVVVCRSGARSGRATAWLRQAGYPATNLDGGMQAWAAAGREMVSDTGETPTVR